MYHVNAQGVDECMINVNYYYYYLNFFGSCSINFPFTKSLNQLEHHIQQHFSNVNTEHMCLTHICVMNCFTSNPCPCNELFYI